MTTSAVKSFRARSHQAETTLRNHGKHARHMQVLRKMLPLLNQLKSFDTRSLHSLDEVLQSTFPAEDVLKEELSWHLLKVIFDQQWNMSGNGQRSLCERTATYIHCW